MSSFVTLEQAADFGFNGSQPALDAATARVQGEARFDIILSEYEEYANGPRIQLSRPYVRSVVSVTSTDGSPVAHTMLPGAVVAVETLRPVHIVYEAGFEQDSIPAPVVELIASVASRIQSVHDTAGTPIEAGYTSEGTGGEQFSMGGIGFSARSGFTPEELRRIRNMFRRRRSKTHVARL